MVHYRHPHTKLSNKFLLIFTLQDLLYSSTVYLGQVNVFAMSFYFKTN